MTQNNREVRWVKLGEFISQRREKYTGGDLPIRGVSREGFIPPKQKEADYSKYNIFYFNDFVFNPARMELNSIALNDELDKGMCSSLYEIFSINDPNILPAYLNMFLKRDEFARQCEYIGSGSAREYCRVANISEISVPVPYKDGEVDVERQREVVEIWQGLRRLKEDNEALAAPLLELCQAKMEELKHTAPMTPLRDFIESCDERNSELSVKLSQGISNMKYFQDPKQTAANSHNDKIVRTGQFAYNRATTRNGEKISIAYRDGADCTVSSAYQIFQLKDHKHFLPKFLMLWFMRPEFDRYARYMSKGSAHEFFEFEEMCRVQVPQPSIQVQQAIVDILACAEKAKAIADEANQQLKTICPALMQHIINS